MGRDGARTIEGTVEKVSIQLKINKQHALLTPPINPNSIFPPSQLILLTPSINTPLINTPPINPPYHHGSWSLRGSMLLLAMVPLVLSMLLFSSSRQPHCKPGKHALSTRPRHPHNSSSQYTFSTYPLNTPTQYNLAIHPHNIPSQYTLLAQFEMHSVNTHSLTPPTLTHPLPPLQPLHPGLY